ncbi:MAG: iron-sulfur cluster-binding domain-containing protein [Chitinophagaceae bacterium]|nr:MAG: iron-sulfur cluster-binding domain-containing protein [Chitinophagaceae bacterium]
MGVSVKKRVRITSIETLTHRAKKLVLEPLDGWIPDYLPGQYLTFIFPHPNGDKRRSYSIVSSPSEGLSLAVAVKKIDNGEFSRQLVYNARPGDILDTVGIQGRFTLPVQRDNTDYFFFAAGSGITPCFALITELLTGSGERVVLVYSNSSREDGMFVPAFEELRDRFPGRFTLHLLFSNAFRIGESRLNKTVLERLLLAHLRPQWNTRFYLCGPELYMLLVTITLRSLGVTDSMIHREDFDTRPRVYKPEPPDKHPRLVTVHLGGATSTFTTQFPDSILSAAKKNGLVLPYSCEAGRCGACVARCTDGEVWMAYNEVLTDIETSGRLILTCQSYPIGGNVTLEIKN